jgi:S1-C subfamily serine protease
MIVHAPHVEVQAQGGVAPEGVYGSWLWFGSPTAKYGFRPTRRVVQIDDVPTPNLDAFLEAIREQRDRQSVRVKTIALDGSVRVQTLKLDLEYWPTQLFEIGTDGWVRVPFEGGG